MVSAGSCTPVIAHMSVGDRALAVKMSPAPVTLCQVLPVKCQQPRPAKEREAPNTQTLAGLNAVIPVISPFCGFGPWVKFLATDQAVPFQGSTYPLRKLAAQTSLLAGALTAISSPASPLGS